MVCATRFCLFTFLTFCATVQRSIAKNFEESVDDKVNTLQILPKDNGLIILDFESFERYVISSPRNYSFVFVVGSRVAKCDPCGPAFSALSGIAKRWETQHPHSSAVFFGFVDFALQMELVKFLRVKTAPFVFHIGPHSTIENLDKTSQPQIVGNPALIAAWISKVSNLNVEAAIPIDYSNLLALFGLAVFCVMLIKIKWLRSIKIIGSLCLIFICSMCSGLMWVSIHSMPFMTFQNGKMVYLYPENRAQFGCECLLIMLFYAMTSGGIVFLTNKCPKIRHRGLLHSIGVLIGVGVATLGFNQMAEYYTRKAGYLPYQLDKLAKSFLRKSNW